MQRRNREDFYATGTNASGGADEFKIQINTYDTYQATPSIFDRSTPPNGDDNYSYYQVPVIRVFGSIPTGHNILAHIHGVFPYIYIPYDNQDCFKFQRLLESAMSSSLRRKKKDTSDADHDSDQDYKLFKYIAHVSVCKGVPFYGYHVGYQAFYKIYLLNPSYSNRLSDLLRDGKVNSKKYECFESHIPYGLQFLTDFNLFGCGWLRLNNLFIRTPILYDETAKTPELVDYLSGYQPTDAERIGYSALEIDVCAQNILNRTDLKERRLHHDFVEKFNLSSPDIYVQSTRDLWKDGDFQRKLKGIAEYSSPPSTSRNPNTDWVETDEHKQLFDYAVRLNGGTDKVEFSTFLKKYTWLDNLKTSFELVTELFYEPELNVEHHNVESSGGDTVEDYDPNDFLLGMNDDQNDGQNNERMVFENFDDNEDLIQDENAIDPFNNIQESSDSNEIFSNETNDGFVANNISDIQLTQNFNAKFSLKRKYSVAFELPAISSGPKNHFKKIGSSRYTYKTPPPDMLDFEALGLPKISYDDPFYTNEVPKPFVHGGKKFKLESKALKNLKQVEVFGESISKNIHDGIKIQTKRFRKWRYIKQPPSYQTVKEFIYQSQIKSQIGVTQKHKYAAPRTNERRPDGSNHMTVLIAEIHVNTRGEFRPDPKIDEVSAIFWRSMNGSAYEEGAFMYNCPQIIPNVKCRMFYNELNMFEQFAEFVRHFDPDIIAGYEVHSTSWGYLIDRSRAIYDFDFVPEISRVYFKSHSKMGDHWGYTHTSSIKICGRHVLNIWRPLRQLNLLKYTIENVSYHALHERIPHFTNKTMTEMFRYDFLSIANHFFKRLEIDSRLIESQELITRAAEEARLIGIDFYDVYYRGSQYKVESFMIRMAKSENFMLSSPSKKQVRHQKPLECIPLVMEPISAYYKSPLVVLDFQSLYPSIVIAYNYCYSTLLGRLRNYSKGSNQIGTGYVQHPPGLLKLLEEDINLSPNGLMFAKSSVRKSLLAKMLEEILDTRFMVKSTMKFLDENLKQLYHSRQLALKLIANVTYGYTSASFSGRMPCSDIADAIVQTARETLDKAVDLIESNSSWGAKVVYGDTDSLFVYLPGRSREDAFRIGKEMADAVTESNPDPVTLKFEKAYHPCVLMAKKRYVGYSYENVDSPVKFDAKGIETVRRDGHPAQQHIIEQCLRILFETNNVSKIKEFVQDQFNKITYNKVSIQDFCFAKEVKIGTYKQPPPGAVVSTKKMEQDARAEPQYRERVPYVIIQETGSILRERARSPEDFLKHNHKLDAEYYIVKTLIPPLERIFNLLGVDIKPWYNELPRPAKKGSIYNSLCFSCSAPSKLNLCPTCRKNELKTLLNLQQRMKKIEVKMNDLLVVCRSCSGHSVECESHDCPVYYTRVKEGKKLEEAVSIRKRLQNEIDW